MDNEEPYEILPGGPSGKLREASGARSPGTHWNGSFRDPLQLKRAAARILDRRGGAASGHDQPLASNLIPYSPQGAIRE
eukprot:5919126-Pyramimonas_sp.AAC.1